LPATEKAGEHVTGNWTMRSAIIGPENILILHLSAEILYGGIRGDTGAKRPPLHRLWLNAGAASGAAAVAQPARLSPLGRS